MWTEEEIDQVENIYIGLWNSGVAGPKLKVFIDAVRRFTPLIVTESLEHIAKTQDKDLRPSISTITAVCREKTPQERTQPPPCDDGAEDKNMSFRDYYRQDRTIDVPVFMHKFLDDDDPRKVKKNGNEEVGVPQNPIVKQPNDPNALGAAQEGRASLADGG
mgnify:CR=1 FL=1